MTPEPRPKGHRAITRGDKGWKEHSNRGNSSEVKKKNHLVHTCRICVILNNKKLFFLKLQSKAPLPPPSPQKSHGDYCESSVFKQESDMICFNKDPSGSGCGM